MIWDNLEHPHLPKKWMRQAATFAYVCMTFVFFRAESIAQGIDVLKSIVSLKWNGFVFQMASALDMTECYIITKALSMKLPGLLSWFWLGIFVVLIAICVRVLRRKSIRRGCIAAAERLWQAVSGASGGFVYLVNNLNDRRERVSLFFVLKGKWRQYDLSGTV